MATIAWPLSLPLPTANGFNVNPKLTGNTTTFQSGRTRVTRTRSLQNDRCYISSSLKFIFTLQEYSVFAEFYDTNWKKLSPQQDSLYFTIGGNIWSGWPSSRVRCSLDENTWSVSFDFEGFLPQEAFTFSTDELDPTNPLWPQDEFPLQIGSKFDRFSSDVIEASDNFLLSRSNLGKDVFSYCTVSTKPADISRIFRLLVWWSRACKCGALPFKLSADNLDLGIIDGIPSTSSGFYVGKFLAPPTFTFDGWFGKASANLVLQPFRTSFTTVSIMIGNDGAWLAGDNGSVMEGVSNG